MVASKVLQVHAIRTACQLVAFAAGFAFFPPTFSAPYGNELARDFLIQKVCVDKQGTVLALDPYKCVGPNHLRNLDVGEPLPYHKVDQLNVQGHDSYPAGALDGTEIIVNRFDFAPFGVFNLWGDGYDIYVVRDGWVSVSETKDGGGYSQTFFGEGCKPYNGWVLFPVAALKDESFVPGKVKAPISGRYWEQDGEPWPGACPSGYGKGSETTWDFLKNFQFGGTDSKSSKTLDAIRVVHGLESTADFEQKGHLEVFFFTRLYGAARWEVWVPEKQNAQAMPQMSCSGDPNIFYEGMHFRRTACRDWTMVTIPSKAESTAGWPIPAMNLLRNFHFAEGINAWNRSGKSREGATTNWSLKISALERDSQYAQSSTRGVRFLAFNCGGTCSEEQLIYQDIPAAGKKMVGTYTLAITASTEAGSGDLELGLREVLDKGEVVPIGKCKFQAKDRNDRFSISESIVLSGTYLSCSLTLPPDPRMRALRFYFSPRQSTTFQIVDAWLMKN